MWEIRQEYYDQVAAGKDPKIVKMGIGFNAWKGGLVSLGMTNYALRGANAANAVMAASSVAGGMSALAPGPAQVVFTTILYASMVGVHYRKYKKGVISKN